MTAAGITTEMTLAPVNQKAAELLHALYAEAQHAARAHDARNGSIRLADCSGERRVQFDCGDHVFRSLTIEDGLGVEWYAQIPTGHDADHARLKPSQWYGSETRKDALGRSWRRLFNAVIDDFGTLVEVDS